MLKLINMCYEVAGLYITIPEGFEVEFIREKFLNDDMLMIKPANKNYTIYYDVEYDCSDAKEHMIETQKRMFKKVYPIEEITVNGLPGYQTTYNTKKQQCHEVRLLVEKSDTGDTEFLMIIFSGNNDIEEIKASDEFKKLLNGIRRKGY